MFKFIGLKSLTIIVQDVDTGEEIEHEILPQEMPNTMTLRVTNKRLVIDDFPLRDINPTWNMDGAEMPSYV